MAISDNTNVHCKYCQSANVVKNGPRKNKSGQLNQKYHCRSCNKYFVLEDQRFVKNRDERMGVVLKEYTDGKSLCGASRSANVSHVTALNWLKKISSTMPDITEAYNEEVQKKIIVAKIRTMKKAMMKMIILKMITSILIKIQNNFLILLKTNIMQNLY